MLRNKTSLLIVSLLFIFISFFACQKPADSKVDPPPVTNAGDPDLPAIPFDYKTVNLSSYISDFIKIDPLIDNTPPDNPITNAGATLGRVLFYDKHLSINDKIACASCHKQELAFTDGNTFSTGFNGGLTTRNAMSIINLRYFKGRKMFWDLRAADLETQVLIPIQNSVEMGMPSLTHVASSSNPTFLIVDNTGQNTGNGSNNGLDDVFTDLGIGGITNKSNDIGTFKIPTLRNIELTAPYMHDGRLKLWKK